MLTYIATNNVSLLCFFSDGQLNVVPIAGHLVGSEVLKMLREEEEMAISPAQQYAYQEQQKAQAGRQSLSFMTKCARTGGSVLFKTLHLTLRETTSVLSALGFPIFPPPHLLNFGSVKRNSSGPCYLAGTWSVPTDLTFFLAWLGQATVMLVYSRGWYCLILSTHSF